MEALEQTRIDSLIKRASEKAGTEYKLAKIMGYSQQQIYDWKTKRKPCPIEAQAIMAEIAGLDAMETIAAALLERNEGTKRYGALEKAVGKACATIREAKAASFGGKADSDTEKIYTQCVLQATKKRRMRRFFYGQKKTKPVF